MVVDDVEGMIAGLAGAGYVVAVRWGPPFAVLSGPGPDLWVSGPETSAAQSSAQLPEDLRAGAAVRPVLQVDDLDLMVESLVEAGWVLATEEVAGPGGRQQLVRRGPVVLEVFCAG
jgi:hypothetical protein